MMDWNEAPIVLSCCGRSMIGVVHHSAVAPKGLAVLIVVGGPQYRVGSHRQFTLMARDLAGCGFPVMRFDYRGMGDSEGEGRTFEAAGEDIHAAIEAFWDRLGGSAHGIVLFGLCDAASAILMHCTRNPRVRALVLANPWVRSESGEARSYLQHYYLGRLLQLSFWKKLLAGEARVRESVSDFLGKLATSRREKDKAGNFIQSMREGLAGFAGPVLILLSGKDLTAREFEDLCRADAEWNSILGRHSVYVRSLPEADHTYSRRADLQLAVRTMAEWLHEVGPGAGSTPCR